MIPRICSAIAVAASLVAALTSAALGQTTDPGRQVLPPNDGWAAFGGGTTGGSTAKPEHVFTVTDRKGLVDALSGPAAPRIVYVRGTINLSVDDSNRELVEKDYADPAYDFQKYVETYKPSVWNVQPLVKGRPPEVSGPLEEARERSAARQKARVVVSIPSDTTLLGVGSDARIVRGNLLIGPGTRNVIIRNIAFEDSFDYFPQWTPTDSFSLKGGEGCQETYVDPAKGPQMCRGGRWNSEYDLISIEGASNVWIDHCTFSDGERPDKLFPPVFPAPHNEFEQKVQHHDGLIDIVRQANYVTLSYNVFRGHDKVHLIGSSDSMKEDAGKLKVTLHHNVYENVMQRMPRVRFGEVHVYNNLFVGDLKREEYPFRYAFGLGTDSRIYSESNVFEIAAAANANDLVSHFRGKAFHDAGSLLNGAAVDVRADFNAANPDKTVSDAVEWKPTLYVAPVLPAAEVKAHVLARAGAGKL